MGPKTNHSTANIWRTCLTLILHFCSPRCEHFRYGTQKPNTQVRFQYVSKTIWGGGDRGSGREKAEEEQEGEEEKEE